jgi:probable RcsB/C two-component-system connector
MKRSHSEKLKDELIGEAVLDLLRNKRPVNARSLIHQLRVMQASEQDNVRLGLIAKILVDMDAAITPRVQDEGEIRLRERVDGGRKGSEPTNSGKLH